jgi:hypothetical protein
MTMPSVLSSTITDDEKRQILYSALLRHFPEAKPLRTRALERLVLGALYGSSESAPATVGDIQSVLVLDCNGTSLRTETIQTVLADLIETGQVSQTIRRKKHAYYLTPNTESDIAQKISDVTTLLHAALRRVTRGCPATVDATTVVKRFICECFARFGRHIAKTVLGELRQDDLVSRVDVDGAFNAAIAGHPVDPSTRDLLRARCIEFLRSTHPDDERLKYYLTQGYYFSHLLGLEENGAARISELVQPGNRFLLDTNIVIKRLLSPADALDSFTEIAAVAKRLSLDVRVTRATINEARRVAALRAQDLNAIVANLPTEIVERSRDNFLSGYLDALEVDPTLTVDQFLAPFDRIRETLIENYGIEVDERVEDDVLRNHDSARVADILQRHAMDTRGWEKGENALTHDVAEYFMVQDDRDEGVQTWVLTQDRSLIHASLDLRDAEQQPFCVSLVGMLQTLSPYVEAREEQSFADVFSKLLLEILPPLGDVYDIQDLRVLAQIQEDVQRTSPERLIEAYDYVRRELSARPRDRYDPAEFVLGLRRFLSSSDDEEKRALSSRLTQAERDVQQLRGESLARAQQVDEIGLGWKEDGERFERDLKKMQGVAVQALRERDNVKRASASQRMTVGLVAFLGGMAVASLMWFLSTAVSRGLASTYGVDFETTRTAINCLASVLFFASSVAFVRYCDPNGVVSSPILTITAAAALFYSGALSDALGSIMSAVLQIGSALSLFLAPLLIARAREQCHDASHHVVDQLT